jgi:triphosphatase
MSMEIELKLAVEPHQIPPLLAWLESEAGPPTIQSLRNIYLDTPSFSLHQQRAALRLRQVSSNGGTHWVQTLKTAGQSVNGLSARHEWECAVSGAALEIEQFPEPARAFLSQLDHAPIPLFCTNFMRRSWRIAATGGAVEVALDEGEVNVLPDSGARTKICELELEWINDDSAAADLQISARALQALASRLHALGPFTPSNMSKAERGYTLYLDQLRA